MVKAIIFDWDGTIAKKEVATKAALRRAKTLGIKTSLEKIHTQQKTHAHFNEAKTAIRNHVGNLDENIITSIMTSLLQFHYLAVVDEEPENVFYKNIIETLTKLKKKGFKLVITSTIREDIIVPVLKNLKINIFDEVFATNHILEYSKEDLVKKAIEKYDCKFIVGDREEDIDAGKKHNLKTILVNWGYAKDLKQNNADNIITKPEELLDIIN